MMAWAKPLCNPRKAYAESPAGYPSLRARARTLPATRRGIGRRDGSRSGPEAIVRKSDWLALLGEGRGLYTIILNLAIGLHAIDVFVISTVMPAVVADIGGAAFYTWPTMLYMVASIVGAASGGPVKAALGARRGYGLAGLVFLIGSAACAASPSMAVLLAARLLQGFGGGLLLSQSMSLVRELYPERLRTRILATISGVWGVAAVLGPLIGGIFAELGWWRGAFWSSVPLILLFTGLAWMSLPASPRPDSVPRFPLGRVLLLGAGVVSVGYTSLLEDPTLRTMLAALAVVMVAATFRLDSGSGNRLFPTRALSLLTPVGTAFWVFFLLALTHASIGVFLPLFLQVLHGMPPVAAGYFNGVLAISWTVASVLTAGWRHGGAPRLIAGGPFIAGISLAILAVGILEISPLAIGVLVALIGLGIGACNLHLTAWSMELARAGEESITASSIPTIRSLGVAFGAAVAGLVANSAGLDRGLDVEHVAAAAAWVTSMAATAPAAAGILALRLIVLRGRLMRISDCPTRPP